MKLLNKIHSQYKYMKRILFFVMGVVITVTAYAQSAQLDADAKYAQQLLKAGEQAPDFKMKTLEGKTFKFAKQTKGKYVLLDFWASWCPTSSAWPRNSLPWGWNSSVYRWIPTERNGRRP